MEKEIKIYVPETLYDVNIASAMVYMKVMAIEGLEPMEKVIQLIASLNDLDIEDVRKIPMKEIDSIGLNILNLFQNESEEYSLDTLRIIEIDGVNYGLEPNFEKIETGAYMDLTDLLSDIPTNLHKIMAILYRPVKESDGVLYNITEYSTENEKVLNTRQEVFLKKMPYAVARATINFMKHHLVN
jgi:hypothetical protein